MKELEKVIRLHAGKYPLMQPADAVKLIYQNEFGGGHLISDVHGCYCRLINEYEAVSYNPDALLYEPIGNGIVRVNLSAIDGRITVDELFSAFTRSAQMISGNTEEFKQKLDAIYDAVAEGFFSFNESELNTYLTEYAGDGYPPVSHSSIYREKYKPAYRIVLAELIKAV